MKRGRGRSATGHTVALRRSTATAAAIAATTATAASGGSAAATTAVTAAAATNTAVAAANAAVYATAGGIEQAEAIAAPTTVATPAASALVGLAAAAQATEQAIDSGSLPDIAPAAATAAELAAASRPTPVVTPAATQAVVLAAEPAAALLAPQPAAATVGAACAATNTARNRLNARAASVALDIVREPLASSSKGRYSLNARLYREMMKEAGRPLDANFRASDKVPAEQCPVSVARALIIKRCGASAEGFENHSAQATGGAIKSAVVSVFKQHLCGKCGTKKICACVDGPYVDNGDGSFSGNPGTARSLTTLIDTLHRQQMRGRCNVPERAYAETHNDVMAIHTRYIYPVEVRAMQGAIPPGRNRDGDWDITAFETSIINIMQWGTVSRADEILDLDIEDLKFTGMVAASILS